MSRLCTDVIQIVLMYTAPFPCNKEIAEEYNTRNKKVYYCHVVENQPMERYGYESLKIVDARTKYVQAEVNYSSDGSCPRLTYVLKVSEGPLTHQYGWI